MSLYLLETLKTYFNERTPLFDQLMALPGDCYRNQEGRTTRRTQLGDKTYFIKQHRGIGWKEIFKNLLQGRLPVTSAEPEWRAINRLRQLGIMAPQVVGFGKRGFNPARIQSFVLLEDITPSASLEEVTAGWRKQAPDVKTKRDLIKQLATITSVMHANGINHRDLYLCHFLSQKQDLYLIDLHRAQIRKRVPLRWRIKDLAGLYFSSKDCGLTKRDLYRFMVTYRQQTLKNIFKQEDAFWQQVKMRGEKTYEAHQHR